MLGFNYFNDFNNFLALLFCSSVRKLDEFSPLKRWTIARAKFMCGNRASYVDEINASFTQIPIQTKTFLKKIVEIKVPKIEIKIPKIPNP